MLIKQKLNSPQKLECQGRTFDFNLVCKLYTAFFNFCKDVQCMNFLKIITVLLNSYQVLEESQAKSVAYLNKAFIWHPDDLSLFNL